MPAVHRDGDSRNCGATTIVSGQSTVYVNGKLIAVEGDKSTHGNGDLVSTSAGTVKINGKKIIVVGDSSMPDLALHTPPATDPSQGSPTFSLY